MHVVKSLRHPALRLLIVLIAALGWLAISNHCVLGMVESAKSVAAPPACHSVPHPPEKAPTGADQAPCCKVLRATVELSKPVVAYDVSAFSLQMYLTGFVVFPDQLASLRPLELDTGPPFSGSFAESVLQRSILAHAPPVSLS
jgi:hypothetical protein